MAQMKMPRMRSRAYKGIGDANAVLRGPGSTVLRVTFKCQCGLASEKYLQRSEARTIAEGLQQKHPRGPGHFLNVEAADNGFRVW